MWFYQNSLFTTCVSQNVIYTLKYNFVINRRQVTNNENVQTKPEHNFVITETWTYKIIVVPTPHVNSLIEVTTSEKHVFPFCSR